jgi:hypothetical protein
MRLSALFAVGVTVLAAACTQSTPTSSTLGLNPTTPTQTTQTFTGTVQVQQSDVHPFTVTQQGEVDVTLTAAGPPPTIYMGLGIGSWDTTSSACTLFSTGTTQTPAGTAPQLSGTAPAGAYCVEVFDIGNQAGPVTYTVTVAHP